MAPATTATTMPPPPADIRSIDLANALVPADSCGAAKGWPSRVPVQLHDGRGDAFPDGEDGEGIAIYDATVVGYADLDRDGSTDVLTSLSCSGTPPARCCAGRGGRLTFAVPFREVAGKLQVVGAAITGGDDETTPGQIDTVALDGTAIRTTESFIYMRPDGSDPQGSFDGEYRWDGSSWVRSDDLGD